MERNNAASIGRLEKGINFRSGHLEYDWFGSWWNDGSHCSWVSCCIASWSCSGCGGSLINRGTASASATSLRQRRRIFCRFLLFQTPPAESTRPTRSTQRSPPGVAAAASDSGFCLACHTHNPSHVAHLYRGDCLKKKRPAARSRSGSTLPTTRRTAPFAQPADTPIPEAAAQCEGGNADDKVQEEVVHAGSNAGGDSRTKERSPTRDRLSLSNLQMEMVGKAGLMRVTS